MLSPHGGRGHRGGRGFGHNANFLLSSFSPPPLPLFLPPPLGERLGEGVMQETIFGLTPSPSLSPKGARAFTHLFGPGCEENRVVIHRRRCEFRGASMLSGESIGQFGDLRLARRGS